MAGDIKITEIKTTFSNDECISYITNKEKDVTSLNSFYFTDIKTGNINSFIVNKTLIISQK